ncbi:DUF3102 domain-containing protein [Methylocella silvestris]|uniref:DUF3102 domain-containing protein n=1 Tax=Methylocella silvestris TaxID=199596 RepID=UPI0015E082F0|nr:DUF3102 domain-containing protein [Methylocella silvestris]
MTISNIATVINSEHRAATAAHEQAVRHAIECGRLLLEAKGGVTHGHWSKWVKQNCDFAMRTAQVYMRIAEHLAGDEAKTQHAAHLSLRELLAEIERAANPPPLPSYDAIKHKLLPETRAGYEAAQARLGALSITDREVEEKRACQDFVATLRKHAPPEQFEKIVALCVRGIKDNGDMFGVLIGDEINRKIREQKAEECKANKEQLGYLMGIWECTDTVAREIFLKKIGGAK